MGATSRTRWRSSWPPGWSSWSWSCSARVQLSRHAADDEAIADARATTELLARSVAEPAIPRGLVAGDAGRGRPLRPDACWAGCSSATCGGSRSGAATAPIVYSDETRLIGEPVPARRRRARGARQRQPARRRSPTSAGRRTGSRRGAAGCSRSTPAIDVAGGRAAAVRGLLLGRRHRPPAPAGATTPFQRDHPRRPARRCVAVATPLLWALTRRLDPRRPRPGAAAASAAADASESERRRIARDLHDGVVQELAGTSFALSGDGPRPRHRPDGAPRLDPMAGGALRSSLRSLRSLLVEIYPPDLGVDGLGAALEDLMAPAAEAGVDRHGGGARRARARSDDVGPPGLAGRPGGGPQRPAARARRRTLTRAGRHGRRPAAARRHRRRGRLRPRRGAGGHSACAACATWSARRAAVSTYARLPARAPRCTWRWSAMTRADPGGARRRPRGRPRPGWPSC